MVGGEHRDLADQADRKRRKRDADEEGVSIIPTDVLLLIFARLTAVDLIRCGAVCVSWSSVVQKEDLSPRTVRPWLAFPVNIWTGSTDDRTSFLDTNTGKTYTIHHPELLENRLVGKSDDGFIVYEHRISKRLLMINHITRTTICFPPLPITSREVDRVFVVSSSWGEGTTSTGYTAVIRSFSEMFSASVDARILKSWGRVSSTLERVSNFGLHVSGKRLCGFLNPVDFGRTEDLFYRFFTCDLHDPTDYKEWAHKFYFDPWSLDDFGGSFPDHIKDDCNDPRVCLEFCCYTYYYPVILPDGGMIVVCRAVVDCHRTVIVKVYRIPTNLQGKAEITTTIGNWALFLDGHHSMVQSTLEFPELKANTIYFNGDCHRAYCSEGNPFSYKGLVMFDLESQHIEEYCPASIRHDECTFSTWVTPTF